MTKLRWKVAQYIEIRWWQNYLKNKSTEDYSKWKTNYWRDFLKNIAIIPEPGTTALDAGCGPAGIFTVLDGLQVDAIDPLLDTYAEKLPHFKKANYPYVTFQSVPLEEFRADKLYDLIFCLNAINHVNDIDIALDNLISCLKSDGQAVISIDVHNHGFFKHLFRLVPADILHPHQDDLQDYRNMFEARGLKILREVRCEKRFLFDYYAVVCELKA